jgi:Uncharacterized alpha/beta hydrolase domain (DUF2235)
MSEVDGSSSGPGVQPEASGAERGNATPQVRRNIVLLSDGTGNSAAKLNKTNVWRLYQALDLGADDQIAFYDDGVGTAGFRPLQLLGGAFGWGLSRNVRDLYEFLCRHYRKGDQIYIFGFSRGAFTARSLAGLIAKCGILDPGSTVAEFPLNTHEGLKAGVRLAYQSYRRGYDHAAVAQMYRGLRDLILKPVPHPEAFRRAYSLDRNVEKDNIEERIRIRFVGVWDTVDAVGLPVDELSTMIDKVFYPHRFPDQDLSPLVERACHAIAIDDERFTFHPVLWNERGTADSERITQVWFPGVHSDVGGGYPDNDLAHVSLQWMIGQVRRDGRRDGGLRFTAHSLRAVEQRAQPLGKMHDSRRGLGVYYRYQPRHIANLCDGSNSDVLVAEPKIHDAAFERIAENITGYAPAALPASYRIVDEHGAVSDLNPTRYETAKQRRSRAELLERAQDHIFWRRVLYYMFVFVTLALVFMPYYRPAIPGAEPEGPLEMLLSFVFGWVPAFLPGSLSSWAGYWTDAWTQSSLWFLVLAVIYALLLWHSGWITANTLRLSELAWWHVKDPDGARPATPRVGYFEQLAKRLRSSRPLRAFHRLSTKRAVPVLAIAFGLYLVLGAAYRFAVYLPGVGDGVCRKWLEAQGVADASPTWDPGSWSKEFQVDTKIPCINTGLILQADQRYLVEVSDQEGWTDGSYAAGIDGLSGVSHLFHPAFVGGVPTRRSLLLPWFTLTAEIGRDSGYTFPIHRERFIVRPARTGVLYVYVNDAINGLGAQLGLGNGAWHEYYSNNAGTATVRVTQDP